MKANQARMYCAALLCSMGMAACGGGYADSAVATTTTGTTTTAAAPLQTIGGTVAGLSGSLVLQNNLGDNLAVSANGTFTFATPLPASSPYSVKLLTQPAPNLFCSVSNGSGIVASANVTNIGVTCVMLEGGSVQLGALNLVPEVSTLTSSLISNPLVVATDGINLYVAGTSLITRVDLATGAVTTLAGVMGSSTALDGNGTVATFTSPQGITTDGFNLYVSDTGNNKIRKISPGSGTLANMTSANAVVSSLTGLADTQSLPGWQDGAASSATFQGANGITTDGVNLYVGDFYNCKIRKIAPSSGTLATMTSATAVVSSLTGSDNTRAHCGALDGTGTSATFAGAYAITTDGLNLYVVDQDNLKIRKIAPSSGTLAAMTSATAVVSSLTGLTSTAGANRGLQDGVGSAATFYLPMGIATDGSSLFVVEFASNKVRKLTPTSGTLANMTNATALVSSLTGTADVATSAGSADGPAATASFNLPAGITTDGVSLYVTDSANGSVRRIQ
jgi:hypothetical protein